MVEAMYERSPAYFKQFQKNFRFFVSEEKPSSMFARNYAVCMHFENGYCELLPSNHYHVLLDVSDVSTEILKRNKLYAVPCLYTTFKIFFHRPRGIVGYKSLDNAKKTLNQQLQTDRISTETLKRFKKILYGPHSGAFCQIMDIFVSGYGKLDIDNDVLCVRLVFEEKKSFEKKIISSNHVSSVRASYEAQIVSIQHHSFFQFLVHQKDNEQ